MDSYLQRASEDLGIEDGHLACTAETRRTAPCCYLGTRGTWGLTDEADQRDATDDVALDFGGEWMRTSRLFDVVVVVQLSWLPWRK